MKRKKTALIKPGKSATLAVTLKSGTYSHLVPRARPRRAGHEDLDHRARRLDGGGRRRHERRRRPTTTSDTTTGGEAWG